MAILFIFACCVEISKCWVRKLTFFTEISRWPGLLVWLLPQSRGPEKGKRGSCFYTSYSDIQFFLSPLPAPTPGNHLLGNNLKWIPRYLKIISLPKVFATKKAYTEEEPKMGTWKEKKRWTIGDNFLTSMKIKPILLHLSSGGIPGGEWWEGWATFYKKTSRICFPSGGEKEECQGVGKESRTQTRKEVRIRRKRDGSDGKGWKKERIIVLNRSQGLQRNTSPGTAFVCVWTEIKSLLL